MESKPEQMGLDEHNIPRLLRSGSGYHRFMTGIFRDVEEAFDDYVLSLQQDQARSRGG